MGCIIEEGNGKYQQWGITNLKPHLPCCIQDPQAPCTYLVEATRCGSDTGLSLPLVSLSTLAFPYLSGNVQTQQLKALAPPLAVLASHRGSPLLPTGLAEPTAQALPSVLTRSECTDSVSLESGWNQVSLCPGLSSAPAVA